jgi:hypothetical protein
MDKKLETAAIDYSHDNERCLNGSGQTDYGRIHRAFISGAEWQRLQLSWISIHDGLPKNGTHCLIRRKKVNHPEQWQWDYNLAEYMAPKVKNEVPAWRVYDLIVRNEDVSHYMIIPEIQDGI